MKKKHKGNNTRRIPFSVWFWLGFAFVMLVLFYMNRKTIAKTVERIQDNPAITKPQIINEDIKSEIENKNKQYVKESNKNVNGKVDEITSNKNVSKEEIEEEVDKELSGDGENLTENKQSLSAQEVPDEDADMNYLEDTRKIELFFATVSNNGMITEERITRVIKRSKSPMKDSINALLQGPTKEEAKLGYRSFIPPDTKLLSATIKNGVATLDFNEDFQFNRYGIEGYNIQLKQVISTACTFEGVKEVQFLIEGQKRDFLGSEGVWIGSPLHPSSF